ncbi:MAG TPA: hypothetical protein VFU98_11730 [Microlunatus sp.]|nr:hypothetical protein [Microlunatus sp.]
MTAAQPVPRWQAALAYALVGPPERELSEPGRPDPDRLLAELGGADAVREAVRIVRRSGEWPHQVPVEMRTGMGAAQYAAAWSAVLEALGPVDANARPVVTDRALTTEERRLLADRPPHHGS